ncbi:F-box protein SNE-like [Zingiber officinale]|uniref:F-box domain-containing protein n=1 Tax=Zingiber officinale TaxID=94328 RepID=A0A8J5L6W6_ZINOF|nr:F-box protein SNE-like [Zingiber officinale]KAG6515100.1 hypothetical protein ZIOFF_025485 [Zingiber officinale]
MLPEEEGRRFSINDNADLLGEILGRLDGRSLATAACVCRLWSAVGRREGVWESVCHRHARPCGDECGSTTRAVVAALGGYRRLYRLCIGPALDRLADGGRVPLSLSLSLFSIDCYERLGVGAAAGGRQQQTPASLLFLCKPVDVS